MANNSLATWVVLCAYFVVSLCLFFPDPTTALGGDGDEEEGGSFLVPVPARHGTVVKKDERWSVVSTEFGEISDVKVSDGRAGFYHLQFITMEPNSLFLPVHLHSDMVFYVDSGSGTLSWADLEKDDDKLRQVQLQNGDVYRLRTGTFFYLQSNLESERRRLRIYAIFSDSKEELREGPSFGAYASVRDLVLGFDSKVLQAALNVEEEVIDELKRGERQPMIVHGAPKVKDLREVHYRIMRAFLGRMNNGMLDVNKKDKEKAYNILTAKHDVENCNGWSLIVTSKQLDALKDSDFGIFLVNLTKGAMMGPHWNPMTAEIAVVLRGRGMVHVVCPSTANETECKNSRFRVEEGDVFLVPRYYPMAQMSFNNGSFVFMGFTTTTNKNHPQYLAGKASVFQTLDKLVLAASFGVSNTTMDQVLSAQREAIILECTSCAEEEERLMEEEIEREEEARREEEEARRREEEKRKKEEEEEAARKREEEEAKEREEAKRKKEEEKEARRQEEETARQEEEARREQEEARKREEEEAREREEEKRRQEEEEEARKQQEEEAARQQEEEETRRRQEEEARRQREQEEEEARRRQQEEEAASQPEEARRRQQEEEAARQQEEARRRQQEEEARERQQEEEEAHGGGGQGHQGQGEGEAAKREEEEMDRREREAEAAARAREAEGQGGQGNGSYEE